MDELKTKIDLIPISDETIKNSRYLPCDLWMVQTPMQGTIGPFHTVALKEYSHKYQYLFEEAKVYNLEEDQWKDMFSVSKFQRRKPQLVSAHNLMDEDEFYIMIQGQKTGPYTKDKVSELLDTSQITTSSQISLDKGKSWIKLYEHHAFDRRSKKAANDLPAKPKDNFLQEVPRDSLQVSQQIKMTEEMLLELSFIKKKKAVAPKTKKRAKTVKPENTKWQKSQTKRKEGWKYGVSTSVIALVLVMAFNYYQNNNSSSFTTEVPTVSKGINNSGRNITKRAPASVSHRTKRSIKKASVKPAVPRFKAAKRRPAARKVSRPQPSQRDMRDTFEQDIENIDINDPDFQQELSRQLANEDEEYFDDEEPLDERRNEEYFPEDGMGDIPQQDVNGSPSTEQYLEDDYQMDDGFQEEDSGFEPIEPMDDDY